MADPKQKRSQILVDARLQAGLSIQLLGWLYFYVVAFALLANAPSIWSVITSPDTESSYFESVQRLQWFTDTMLIPLALTFVCVAAHGLLLTHRIAGPIYRAKAVLRDLMQRKYPDRKVAFRDKDYFADLAEELNGAVDALRDDAARERRMNAETVQGLVAVISALEAGDRTQAEVLALAHQALDRAERLDRHLGVAAPVQAPAAEPAAAEPAAAETAPADATSVTS